MKYSVKKDDETNIIKLKNGLYMLYDHVLRNNGTFVHNEGTWGNPKEEAGCRRVTLDDMQMFCIHGDRNCRITDFGKKVITIMMPNEKPIFFCGYHAFEHALLDRFTEEGMYILNRGTEFAHP